MRLDTVNRWPDWFEPSAQDLRHARNAAEDEDFEWAAFAAQQSAEKAVKALIIASGGEPWGHSVTNLLENLPDASRASIEIIEAGKRLDKHYVPTRYPNGFDSGYPGKLYTRGEADSAIKDAESIADFCRRHLPR